MKFWKMNGAGNDFIIIDNRECEISESEFSYVAKVLCERHLSIGADGLMIIEAPKEGGDCRMIFLNSDGSYGEMCGNGARCISRYCYERKISTGSIQTIETHSGIVKGYRLNEQLYKVQLNNPSEIWLDRLVEINGTKYEYSYVELGKPGIPHAVVRMDNLKDIKEAELFDLGRAFRYCSDFPKGANVNFYEVIGEDLIYERTWERGVEDFTYACGTGTASVVTVLTLKGEVSGENVAVDMQGGRLIIDVIMSDDVIEKLYLTGETNVVAKGEITDENLII